MGWLDAILILLLCYGAYRGFSVGLLRSVFDLIGWIAAFVIGFKFAEPVALKFFSSMENPDIALVLGFALVVLIVVTTIGLVVRVLQQFLKVLRLKLTDQVLGAGFGVFKNAFVILLLMGALGPLLSKFSFYQNSLVAARAQAYVPVAVTSAQWLKKRGQAFYEQGA